MYAPNPHPENREIMPAGEIRRIVGPIAERFGVHSVYLFGSVARGEADGESDYDFSIMEGRLTDYYEMLDFCDTLAEALGRDVDVITFSDLGNEKMIADIARDGIPIYREDFIP